jgi:hypothetical protein
MCADHSVERAKDSQNKTFFSLVSLMTIVQRTQLFILSLLATAVAGTRHFLQTAPAQAQPSLLTKMQWFPPVKLGDYDEIKPFLEKACLAYMGEREIRLIRIERLRGRDGLVTQAICHYQYLKTGRPFEYRIFARCPRGTQRIGSCTIGCISNDAVAPTLNGRNGVSDVYIVAARAGRAGPVVIGNYEPRLDTIFLVGFRGGVSTNLDNSGVSTNITIGGYGIAARVKGVLPG